MKRCICVYSARGNLSEPTIVFAFMLFKILQLTTAMIAHRTTVWLWSVKRKILSQNCTQINPAMTHPFVVVHPHMNFEVTAMGESLMANLADVRKRLWMRFHVTWQFQWRHKGFTTRGTSCPIALFVRSMRGRFLILQFIGIFRWLVIVFGCWFTGYHQMIVGGDYWLEGNWWNWNELSCLTFKWLGISIQLYL